MLRPLGAHQAMPLPAFGVRQVMQKAGNVQAMLKKGPFSGGGAEAEAQLKEGERKLKNYAAFVEVRA